MELSYIEEEERRLLYEYISDKKLKISLKQAEELRHGIFEPLKVRPMDDMGYQIISGHNRVAAAQKLGLYDLPCIVKNLNDDQAKIELIETNLLHRSDFVASEKAKAYRIRADILAATSSRTTSQIAQCYTH